MAQKARIEQYQDGSVVISNLRNNLGVPVFGPNDTITATLVSQYYDGSAMNDSKVDGKIYLKLKALPPGADASMHQYVGKYFLVNLPNSGETFLEKDAIVRDSTTPAGNSVLRELSSTEILLLKMKYYKGVKVSGYYKNGDTPGAINYYLLSTPATDDGGSVIEVGGIKLVHKFLFLLEGSYYGISALKPDNSESINKAIDYVKANKPMVLRYPSGVIKYSSMQNIAIGADGVTYEGHAPNCTTLEFIGGGVGSIAINANAWQGSTLNTPFARNITIRNINLLLSPTTKTGLHLEGIARSIFENIRVNGGDKTDGIAVVSAVMLSHFYNLRCSYADGEVPYEALRSTGMIRGGTQNHNNSDNTYYDVQLEGTAIGATLLRTDQSTFIGGVIEACTYRGLVINGTSGGRYNTFIGTSFESASAEWDIIDNGTHNFYSGIYAPYMNLQGSMNKVANAFFSLLQIGSSGQDNILENITYSRWVYAGRTHGLVDNGIRTRKINTFNYATGNRDKNYGLFDGSIISDSFRNRVITNYSENLAKADGLGGFIPFQNSSSIDSNITSGGSGIAVHRRGAADVTNDTGAWRLWTSNVNDGKLKFLKLNSTGVWNSYELVNNTDLATLTLSGVVKQSAKVNNISVADVSQVSTANATNISASSATTIEQLVTDYNVMVGKYNSEIVTLSNQLKQALNLVIVLSNACKGTVNDMITKDVASGQRSNT